MATFEPQFWCVWREGGGSPTVQQPSFEKAKREAQRLARANPGQQFVVLAAAIAFVKDDVREVRFVDDGAFDLDDKVPF